MFSFIVIVSEATEGYHNNKSWTLHCFCDLKKENHSLCFDEWLKNVQKVQTSSWELRHIQAHVGLWLMCVSERQTVWTLCDCVSVCVCLFEEDSEVSFSSWVAIRKERSAVNDEHCREESPLLREHLQTETNTTTMYTSHPKINISRSQMHSHTNWIGPVYSGGLNRRLLLVTNCLLPG